MTSVSDSFFFPSSSVVSSNRLTCLYAVSRHEPGSAGGVLLSKWLGDLGADSLGSMLGTDSMTSSDWMLLALSAMGQDSQKKVGQAFVQRLLEKGDIHPAVAILLGLGEYNDAIEVYVSRKHYMEAVLLTCLLYPNDWKRQSYLVRKWGEYAVAHKQPELAVRCFSCTSLESAEPWTSPTAEGAVFAAQQENFHAQLSPPLSPPGAGMPSRLKNSSLKLITTFGEKPPGLGALSTTDEQTPMNTVNATPIAESALSPGGHRPWSRTGRSTRDPSSARTATPGAYTKRRRFPSRSDGERSLQVDDTPIIAPARRPTPQTAIDTRMDALPPLDLTLTAHKRPGSRASSAQQEPILLSAVAYDPSNAGSKPARLADALPSPAVGVFDGPVEARSRNGSRSRKPEDLHLNLGSQIIKEGIPSSRRTAPSPAPLTNASLNSLKSDKVRSIDEYISSLDEANHVARQQRAESRRREEQSRDRKPRSRQPSETRSTRSTGTGRVRYIKPAKRSPSSPVSMSPDENALYNSNADANNYQDERYYSLTSPVESRQGRTRSRSKTRTEEAGARASSKAAQKRAASRTASRNVSRNRSRQPSPEGRRSPISPLPMSHEGEDNANAELDRTREQRHRSKSRHAGERGTSARRDKSPDRRNLGDRPSSRHPQSRDPSVQPSSRPVSPEMALKTRRPSQPSLPKLQTNNLTTHAAQLARKEAAARELEERRLSLARRPSAPVIPHPEELSRQRHTLNRSVTDFTATTSPTYSLPSTSYADRIPRSQTVDPESLSRYQNGSRYTGSGASTPTVRLGLPATPRAMRHPGYMGSADANDRDVPAVPELPKSTINSAVTPANNEAESLVTLLPATTYGQPIARAASAPPEKFMPQRRGSIGSNGSHHRRKPSGGVAHKRISPPIIASIDETLNADDNQIIIIEDGPANPPILPQLQHLSGPPPPPPPPSMFQPGHKHSGSGGQGVINIAIEEEESSRNGTPLAGPPPPPLAPLDIPPVPSTSPQAHRRGRGSVSENIGSRFRQVTERMRSTSRSRNKSPPAQEFTPSPYESVIPPFNFSRRESVSSAPSTSHIPPPPPPPPVPSLNGSGQLMEQVISPSQEKANPNLFASYMRHPKEIRANMPPAQLQPGVMPVEGGMI